MLLPSGSEAAPGGVGPQAHLLRGHIQHHRRVRHRHLERGAPQDRVWLQPHGPRLPRPRPLGQRSGGAQGSGDHRGGVSTQGLSADFQEPHDATGGETSGGEWGEFKQSCCRNGLSSFWLHETLLFRRFRSLCSPESLLV